MAKVKITVVKKLNLKDLYGDDCPVAFDENIIEPECDWFDVGQEFVVADDPLNCPDGFCHWAFSDIYNAVAHLLFGGDYYWIKEKGVALSCCTDAFRPVIFKIERIED